MNIEEMSKKTGMHKNTIYKLIKEGIIKAEKKGKSYEVPENEVEVFLRGKIPFIQEQDIVNASNLLIKDIEEHQQNEIIKIAFLGKKLFDNVKALADKKNENKINEDEFYKKVLELKSTDLFTSIFNGMNNISKDETLLFNLDKVKGPENIKIKITADDFLGWCKDE